MSDDYFQLLNSISSGSITPKNYKDIQNSNLYKEPPSPSYKQIMNDFITNFSSKEAIQGYGNMYINIFFLAIFFTMKKLTFKDMQKVMRTILLHIAGVVSACINDPGFFNNTKQYYDEYLWYRVGWFTAGLATSKLMIKAPVNLLFKGKDKKYIKTQTLIYDNVLDKLTEIKAQPRLDVYAVFGALLRADHNGVITYGNPVLMKKQVAYILATGDASLHDFRELEPLSTKTSRLNRDLIRKQINHYFSSTEKVNSLLYLVRFRISKHLSR